MGMTSTMFNRKGLSILILRNLVTALAIIVTATMPPWAGVTLSADELALRPIEVDPEPLTQLDPKLSWMIEQKVRAAWIGDDLFAPFGDSGKTKGQVLVEAGFNLARLSMNVNTDDKRESALTLERPAEVRHDRTKSTVMETRLAPNVAAAGKLGLPLMIGWQYGTHHKSPYRKYRSFDGKVATYSVCPLDEPYIAGQHIGRWAVAAAEGGADGFVIDTEMYHSDAGGYYAGSCVCDECFATYLKTYAATPDETFAKVAAGERGAWLTGHEAASHYAAFAATRVEAMYDSIRQRCWSINPSFFFGVAPMLHHIRGMERGLGTSKVPCLIFSEHEYHHGPYRGSFRSTNLIRQQLPALFMCGAYLSVQPPLMFAESAMQGSLYTDGWWAYYGTALLTDLERHDGPWNGYTRVLGTTAGDYLDLITATHEQLDELLGQPPAAWPPRVDGKHHWLKAKLADAITGAAEASVNLTNAQKAAAAAKADLEAYEQHLRRDAQQSR